MAIKNTVSIDFYSMFLDSIGVFDCRLPGVNTVFVAYHLKPWPVFTTLTLIDVQSGNH